jgi:cytochrome P450
MLSDPDLIPFEPPPKPVGLTGLATVWRNYVETIPRAAYEEGVTRVKGRFSDDILACDPDLIQEILVEKADAFVRDEVTRRAFAPVIGMSSLFLAEGADWRWQRRAVASIFRHEALLSFVPIFVTAAERQVERWRSPQHDPTVDAADAMTLITFDIIVAAILGGAETLDAERYRRALNENFNAIPWQIIYDLFSLPRWLPFPGRGRAMRARDFLHRDIARIVAAQRAQPSPKPDLLDLLLAARDPESGRSMTDMDVVTNLLTFIAAGHETTAVALTWTLWLLAKDQSVQEQVYEEAVAVAGDGPVAAAHVERLAFTRQVLQEAMRLFPPAPSMSREPKEPMQLGGMQLTRRSRVHIPIYALHRNLRLWSDPNTFNPDRFAPNQVKARPRYAYLPFGGGPRVCIGASFAMIEATVILATLARAVRFQPVAGYHPKTVTRITLRPAGGLPLRMEPR